MGGKLTLSDDSHGVAQVGLNFQRTVRYLESLGVERLYYLERPTTPGGITTDTASKRALSIASMPLAGLLDQLDDYPSTA